MMQPPTIRHILRRDWTASCLLIFAALFAVMALVFGGIVGTWGAHEANAGLIAGAAALVAAVVCGGISLWRLGLVHRVLSEGHVAQGIVVRVGETEEIGYAIVQYRHQGEVYRTRNLTQGAPGRGGLVPGQTVDLVVDPRKPSRAFIVSLFA